MAVGGADSGVFFTILLSESLLAGGIGIGPNLDFKEWLGSSVCPPPEPGVVVDVGACSYITKV